MTGALALIERAGSAEAVTLRAVAREVGIAAPSIYPHFADRDAIVTAVVARVFDELAAAIEAGRGGGRAGPGGPAGRRLRGLRGLRARPSGPVRRAVHRAARASRGLLPAGRAGPGRPAGAGVGRRGVLAAAARPSRTASRPARRPAPTWWPTPPRSGSRCTERSRCAPRCPASRGPRWLPSSSIEVLALARVTGAVTPSIASRSRSAWPLCRAYSPIRCTYIIRSDHRSPSPASNVSSNAIA